MASVGLAPGVGTGVTNANGVGLGAGRGLTVGGAAVGVASAMGGVLLGADKNVK